MQELLFSGDLPINKIPILGFQFPSLPHGLADRAHWLNPQCFCSPGLKRGYRHVLHPHTGFSLTTTWKQWVPSALHPGFVACSQLALPEDAESPLVCSLAKVLSFLCCLHPSRDFYRGGCLQTAPPGTKQRPDSLACRLVVLHIWVGHVCPCYLNCAVV